MPHCQAVAVVNLPMCFFSSSFAELENPQSRCSLAALPSRQFDCDLHGSCPSAGTVTDPGPGTGTASQLPWPPARDFWHKSRSRPRAGPAVRRDRHGDGPGPGHSRDGPAGGPGLLPGRASKFKLAAAQATVTTGPGNLNAGVFSRVRLILT